MAGSPLTQFLHRLRRSPHLHGGTETTDTELLQRYLADREEAAFEALVQRHGPMVLSVCRYVVQNSDDAEDAFQATFLVLVRRAASIRKPELLGNWLYGVAHRVATRARVQAARRRAQEKRGVEMIAVELPAEVNELRPVLHEELNRLPEKYRAPIVLCYLQGQTNEQAARLLAWPIGTVKGRLTRARELLRKRLTRRGVTLTAGVLAGALAPCATSTAVPVALVNSTVRSAMLIAAGPVATAGVSLPVAALTKGVLQTMFLIRLTTVSGIVVGVSLLGTTSALFTYRGLAAVSGQGHTMARAEPPGRTDFKSVPPRSVDERKQHGQKQKAADQAEEADRVRSVDNLKVLGLAMHNYHATNGQFPPAAIYSKDGKPLLSWRVLLLPYVDQQDLFTQFKLDEPWDGPTNKKLLARMPEVYAAPRGKAKGTHETVYRVLTGTGTIFPGPKASRIADITDGTSNTILIAEAAEAVPWTKPAELPYDPMKPLPKLGGMFKERFHVTFADGSVHFLKHTINEATLRALITCNGGEIIDTNELN
jgi:RNA polymerase sigma factor (sigma-70 family)